MPIVNQKDWDAWVKANSDSYGKACVDVARKVMEYLDERPGDFDAHDLITEADKTLDVGGITGFMAGAAAQMVSHCHSRGKEFNKNWNKSWGSDEEEGTVNPAILTINTD